jgi:hypothetical protein
VDTTAFMRLSTHMIVKVALIFQNLSSKIYNYKENIESGELKIVNFKPYYESALHGNLSTFKKLKTELEKTQRQRISEGKKDAILPLRMQHASYHKINTLRNVKY